MVCSCFIAYPNCPERKEKTMIDELKKGLSLCDDKYADIRYEEDEMTRMSYRGKELESFYNSVQNGFHLRVLAGGGMCSASFNNREDLPRIMKETSAAAKIGRKYRDREIDFKLAKPVTDRVLPAPRENPRQVPLEEKLRLLTHYNRLVLKMPTIQSTILYYYEWVKNKSYLNTENNAVEQQQIICGISGEIIARDGKSMENVRASVGGCEDFTMLRNREDVFERKAQIVSDLLRAEKPASGTYRVLLNQPMVGLFIHEAFGHFSEADLVKDNPGLLKRLRIGNQLGPDFLNVVDDPAQYGRPGYYVYDDEGVRGTRTTLIKNGVLTGRLHSMETAADMGEDLTGNGIAVGWRHTPIVRMSNIFVEPGEMDFESLLDLVGTGLYICDAKGGSTMGDEFAFGAQYGFEVRRGKTGKLLKGINMSGNLFVTMKKILGIGDDIRFGERGGCGKDGQTNPQSGSGGPHTVIDDVIIG